MDKSLDDIIAEQRTKSKPRSNTGRSSDHRGKPAAAEKSGGGRDRRRPQADSRRDGRKVDAAGPPPRDPNYFMHDDRNGWGDRQQQGGPPRGSWKQQQRQQWERQQQRDRPRGRGNAAASTDPIITTADGWEEVAQDEPYTDRRGGPGAQRRGGVFDRLSGGDRANGGAYHTRSWDRRGDQQQFGRGGGGRFGRARGRGGRGRGDDWGGEPRRRYVDEHDHREDFPSGGGSDRPGRFQPYRVAGGVSKPSARGPAGGRRKWSHDLFDPNQPAGDEVAAAAAEEGGNVMLE